MRPPLSVYFAALHSKLLSTCTRRAGSAESCSGVGGSRTVIWWFRASRRGRCRCVPPRFLQHFAPSDSPRARSSSSVKKTDCGGKRIAPQVIQCLLAVSGCIDGIPGEIQREHDTLARERVVFDDKNSFHVSLLWGEASLSY